MKENSSSEFERDRILFCGWRRGATESNTYTYTSGKCRAVGETLNEVRRRCIKWKNSKKHLGLVSIIVATSISDVVMIASFCAIASKQPETIYTEEPAMCYLISPGLPGLLEEVIVVRSTARKGELPCLAKNFFQKTFQLWVLWSET